MHTKTSTGTWLLGGLLVALVLGAVRNAEAAEPQRDELLRGFQSPPQEAKPWVYWWFQGGYGDPQGMARDVAAMTEKGIGGVMHMQTINAGGLPLPKEPKMLDADWDAWFGEALRIARDADMTFSASIVDGWAHGGWWVNEENGAKQLVHSETQCDGPGTITSPLPMPLARLGLYRDVAVVAFKERTRRPPTPWQVSANSVYGGYCDEENWPADHAVDGDPATSWRTHRPCSPKDPALLDLTFAEPIAAAGALVASLPGAGPADCALQVSDDAQAFRPVTQWTMEAGESKRVAFAVTTARHFRLSISRAHAPDLKLADFQLLREGDVPVLRPGIKWWDFKSANRAWWQWPPQPYEALEEEYQEDGASDVSADDVVDVSQHLTPDGRLDWPFPAGRWTVLRFGWTPLGEPARMGSGGYEVDVLSPRRADLMMDTVAQRMRDLSVQHAGGAPIMFHTDSWEIGAGAKGLQPTWTEDFREQFKQRRGYDLLRYLPAMARRIVGDRQTTNRFLFDYRATVADLLAAYYGRLQERAHAMNGGMNSESGYGSYPHPHMDGLQVFGRADRPMAEFWHPFPKYGPEFQQWVDAMHTAASGARIYGHRFVQAETLTYHPWQGQFTPPEQYRGTLHEAWARGLNQAVIHKYTHQPLEVKPGVLDYDIFNRNMCWWPLAEGLIGYMGRSQYLLQQGDFVADAAYFVGEGATRFVPGKAYLNPVLPPGYDYDGINAEVLHTRAQVKDGRLVLPGGMSYRYLVLCDPQCVTMTATTLARIRQLVEQGLSLVGRRPLRTPGLTDLPAAELRLARDAAALWGEAAAEQGDRKVGLGRVRWGQPMHEILAADQIAPDCEATSADKPWEVSWLHRRRGSDEIYFLSNPQSQPIEGIVTFRAQGDTVQLFDPLDGSSRDLPEKSIGADGRTLVPLRFEPQQALFVILRAGPARAATGRNVPALQPVLTVEGPWRVSFDAQWVKPLPSSVAPDAKEVSLVFAQLTDWSQHSLEGIKGYSGLATYRTSFDLPTGASPDRPMCLDVGLVKEMARVELNGQSLGVAWCPPWRLKIPASLLKIGENELVITLANNWHNRLCADAALPEGTRLTVVGHDLHQWAAKEGFQPSGLLGPVRVLAMD